MLKKIKLNFGIVFLIFLFNLCYADNETAGDFTSWGGENKSIPVIRGQIYEGSLADEIVEGVDIFRLSEHSGTFRYIKLSEEMDVNHELFFSHFSDYFPHNVDEQLIYRRSTTDELGITHHMYRQFYGEYPVYGATYLLHENKQGRIYAANGDIFDLSRFNDKVNLSAPDALQTVTDTMRSYIANTFDEVHEFDIKSEIKEIVVLPGHYHDFEGYKLTYIVNTGIEEGIYTHKGYVDASSGELVKFFDLQKHFSPGTADTYYDGIQDIINYYDGSNYQLKAEYGSKVIEIKNHQTSGIFLNGSSNWGTNENDATQALFGAIETLKYWDQEHNISNGFSSKLNIQVRCIETFMGCPNIATYFSSNPPTIRLGDGDNSIYSTWSSIDILAHEMAHGLFESYIDPTHYWGESGAIEEAFADINGILVKFHSGAGTQNWLLGDQFNIQGNPMRRLDDPKSIGHPDTYLGEYWHFSGADNQGVHYNNGIINYWFYLLSEGGSGTNDNDHFYNVSSIGMDKAADILFRTIKNYLTTYDDFNAFRLLTLQATNDLYSSTEYSEVNKAWTAVGLPLVFDNFFEAKHLIEPMSFDPTCEWEGEEQQMFNDCIAQSDGAHLIDFNRNGLIDVFIPTHVDKCNRQFLYINNGDGTFTRELLLEAHSFTIDDVAWGDFTNNGYPDLAVLCNKCASGSSSVLYLFENNEGVLNDVTNGSGTFLNDPDAMAITWAEVGINGYIDLIVVGHSYNRIFSNSGNGSFTEITTAGDFTNYSNASNIVLAADINNNQLQDLFVGNEVQDYIFFNQGNGTFIRHEVSGENGINTKTYTATIGDFSNNGFFDIFVGGYSNNSFDFSSHAFIYKNLDGGTNFEPTNLWKDKVLDHSSSGAGDIMNNGRLDLVISQTQLSATSDDVYIPDLLLINEGEDLSMQLKSILYNTKFTTSIAFGDLNNNGKMDLVRTEKTAYPGVTPCPNDEIFENIIESNNYIRFTCEGTVSNKGAIGTRINVKADINEQSLTQIRDVQAKTGRKSGGDRRPHFGLKDAEIVETVYVLWPSGIIQYMEDIPVNQTLSLVENQPLADNDTICPGGTAELSAYFGYILQHQNNFKWYDDEEAANPIHTGNNFTTPVLYETTTFYVTNTHPNHGEGTKREVTVFVLEPEVKIAASGYEPLTELYISPGTNVLLYLTAVNHPEASARNPIAYQWYRNSVPIDSGVSELQTDKPGCYELSVKTECGEISFMSNAICINFECTNDIIEGGYVNEWEPSEPSEPSEPVDNGGEHEYILYTLGNAYDSHTVNETIIIPEGYKLIIEDITLFFPSCQGIIVEAGGILEVNNSYLTACESVWLGIQVHGDYNSEERVAPYQGELYLNDAEISNAHVGVLVGKNEFVSEWYLEEGGGYFEIEYSLFDNNGAHMIIAPYPYPNYSIMDGVQLQGINMNEDALVCYNFEEEFEIESWENPYILISENEALTFNDLTFIGVNHINIEAEPIGTIIQESADITFNSGVYNTAPFKRGFKWINVSESIIENYHFNIDIDRVIDLKQGSDNIISHSFIGIDNYNIETGIRLDQSYNTIILQNEIFGALNGVVIFDKSGSGSTIIKENDFINNRLGLVISTHEHPESESQESDNEYNIPLEVEIECNKFFDNYVAILGSGDLQELQHVIYDDMGNLFIDNIDYDGLWHHLNNVSIHDYFAGSNNQQMGQPYVINGTWVDYNNNDFIFAPTFDPHSCRNLLIATDIKNKPEGTDQTSVKLYPNPFSNELIINLKSIPDGLMTLVITDIGGRQVYSKRLQHNEEKNLSINTESWSEGAYFIQLYQTKVGLIHYDKAIKINFK